MAAPKKNRKKHEYAVAESMIFFALAIASFLGMLHPFDLEPFDSYNKLMKYMLGRCHILLPFIFLIMSVRVLLGIRLVRLNKSFVSFIIMSVCVPALFHHIRIPVREELVPTNLIHGGGIWGGTIALILHRAVGEYMTVAILASGIAVALGLVIPWGQLLSSDKDDEEYDKYLKETGKSSADSSPKKAAADKKNEQTKPEIKANTESASSLKQNVYGDEEFSSFTEGIKQKSTFKRILNFGFRNKTYTQDDIKEQLEKDPIQLPEWEEEGKRSVILRPAVRYGDEPQTDRRKEAESGDTVKAYKSIIDNPYRDLQGEQAGAESDSAAVTGFVIHKSADEAGYNPAFDGYVDAAQALQEGAGIKKAAGTEKGADEQQPPEKAMPAYIFPSYDLLAFPSKKASGASDAEIMQQCSILEQTLADFRVRANVIAATRGPAVTQFEIMPAPGVKVNSVVNLADDIALRLAAPGVRIEAPIPGKSAIGIEVPNIRTDSVYFREVVDTDIVRNKSSKLCIGLGKDISGNIITADMAKMPHLLIAGSTGSGKSVCINTIICGILYKALPDEVKLILVDPKVVELSVYDGIPHLLTPVVTDPKKAASALHWAVVEMERRYKLFADNHVRNIDGYNKEKSSEDKIPYIVIIIDEMADLMASVKADIETAVMRLAAKARAAGIHMILATQRPSVDVITGVLKNNIPSRIAFAVTSLTDSRTILDAAGAEKLLGKGDMLYSPYGSSKPTRIQGAFVSDEEVAKIVESIISQSIPVEYSEEVTSVELESERKSGADSEDGTDTPGPMDDPLFEKALMLVLDTGQASASMMQRRFSIGYNRAARLVDAMVEQGIVGKAMGSKPREVIMPRQEAEQRFLDR